jgi:hypothetical protein
MRAALSINRGAAAGGCGFATFRDRPLDRVARAALWSARRASREDKKKNMSSLFAWKRYTPPALLSLPAFCTPTVEAESLRKKREAQLEWMRANGVKSLVGAPINRPVTWEDVTVEPARTLPAQRVAERAVAALHSLRRLNAEKIEAPRERSSGKAA